VAAAGERRSSGGAARSAAARIALLYRHPQRGWEGWQKRGYRRDGWHLCAQKARVVRAGCLCVAMRRTWRTGATTAAWRGGGSTSASNRGINIIYQTDGNQHRNQYEAADGAADIRIALAAGQRIRVSGGGAGAASIGSSGCRGISLGGETASPVKATPQQRGRLGHQRRIAGEVSRQLKIEHLGRTRIDIFCGVSYVL